ncbi:MAG: KTSC domain-containing protein [Caldilineaceae bacterium]
MVRRPVVSSSLASVGYDERRQILEIEFHDGALYQYFDVPAYVYTGLMSMGSHGYYFHTFIKNGGYRYQRV